MDKTMTQDQRLSFLVEAFKADSGGYQNLTTPKISFTSILASRSHLRWHFVHIDST